MRRYLKVTDGVVFATDTLTKDDLMRARAGSYCAIIDLRHPDIRKAPEGERPWEAVTYPAVYNPQENRWDAIQNI